MPDDVRAGQVHDLLAKLAAQHVVAALDGHELEVWPAQDEPFALPKWHGFVIRAMQNQNRRGDAVGLAVEVPASTRARHDAVDDALASLPIGK